MIWPAVFNETGGGMAEIVEFKSGDGVVRVEVEGQEPGTLQRSSLPGGDKIVKAADSFEDALAEVVPAADKLLEKLKKLQPDSAELEFGVKLSGQLGGMFAKAAGEGQITVRLSWDSIGADQASSTASI